MITRDLKFTFYTLPKVQQLYNNIDSFLESLANMCNCTIDHKNIKTTIECLQNVPAETIIANEYNTVEYTINMFPFVPTIDGKFLTNEPKEMFETCSVDPDISILIGNNKNEGFWSLMYFLDGLMPNRELSEEEMKLSMVEYFGYVSSVLSFYPKEVFAILKFIRNRCNR